MFERNRPKELIRTEINAAVKGLKSGRRLGDVKAAPDGFQRRLRDIDPGLSAHWNRVRCIWQIWGASKSFGQAVVLHVCEGDPSTGTYTPLDSRILELLRRMDGSKRDVVRELAEQNVQNLERAERNQVTQDADYAEQELGPRLKYDLTHEVSHSKSGISIGGMNLPKEDLKPKPFRAGRFGARPAPAHLAQKAMAYQPMDMDIEVE
tara:strand:+ start:182 stop:802 length:621 start_codon:yes stop_codon:yes gene_type:complete